jgi:leader peptidase (prepilin peptidase) / N-methyltransferase
MIIYYFLIFIAGLLIGSFLNVCIYRIPESRSIVSPPSSCPGCGRRLSPADLIPVFSYIFLKGRCRYCREKISPRYVIVELLTASIITLTFYEYGFGMESIFLSYIACILITVFFIDLKHKIIPDGLVITGIIGGAAAFVYNLFLPLTIMGDRFWWNPLLGAVCGSGILLIIALLGMFVYKSDEVMGMGDVKIFIPIGMFLGWKMALFTLLVAIVSGGLISFILVAAKIKKRKDTVPFGPFIVAGAVLAILAGWDLLNLYIKVTFS